MWGRLRHNEPEEIPFYSKVISRMVWLVPAVLIVCGAYFVVSITTYGPGFPLDDAWIHQTYARNLGLYGEWAYRIGQPSAGSTSPLWTALLAASYILGIPHLVWTYLLGCICLLGVAWLGDSLMHSYLPDTTFRIPWAGLFLIGEWHLGWASLSGMETLLQAALVLLVLLQIGRVRNRAWGWIGLLVGLGIWIRPDAITLVGPAVLIILIEGTGWKKFISNLIWLVMGAASLMIPYLIFNDLVQGSIWPNTFYAKQAEYAELRTLPLHIRYLNELRLPLIGSGVLLLPGVCMVLWRALKLRNWPVLAGFIWFAGFAFLYALRLPVTYQYGRYIMPAMPVFFVQGLAGTFLLIDYLRVYRVGWILARVGVISTILVWLAFNVIGAQRYGVDVAIIETEMVAPAQWIARNLPSDTLIAAHDIGAAGYFADHHLVDLAGLISPEVIPIMRDEEKLATYLDDNEVDYLVVFEGWYELLPNGKKVIYRSNGKYSPAIGGTNMVIYRWK